MPPKCHRKTLDSHRKQKIAGITCSFPASDFSSDLPTFTMPIYIRTALGSEAALDSKSVLPPKLRKLLIAVDGRTKRETYASRFAALGSPDEVEALIDTLLRLSLVQERFGAVPAPKQPAPAPQASLQMIPADAPKSPSLQAALARKAAADDIWLDTERSSLGDIFREDALVEAPSEASVEPKPEPEHSLLLPSSAQPQTPDQIKLKRAVAMMAIFVRKHFAHEAEDLALGLERLASVEQLIASLKSYESMVTPVGPAARQHLSELRRVMAVA
jgi:hypothetical protein